MTGRLSKKGTAAAAGGVGLLLALYCGGYAYLRGTGRFLRVDISAPARPTEPGALGVIRLKVTGRAIVPAGHFDGPGGQVLFNLYLPARRTEEAYWWASGRLTGRLPYEYDFEFHWPCLVG